MSTRLDFLGRFDAAPRRTPQGGLRFGANLTRVGVLPYRQPDGTIRRELRPPEEVFAPESLESLRLAPVTVGHPGVVSPSNYSAHAKGIVAENVREASPFVAGDVLIQDGATCARVGTDLVETSCGYEVKIDHTPGVWEGQPYDVVQRQIRYNHVGLGPLNWGRAGNEVRLHLDGGEPEDFASYHYDGDMRTIDQVQAELDALKIANDKLSAENAKLKTDAADPAKSSESQVTATKEFQIDQKEIDRAIASRLDLLTKARGVLGASFSHRRSDAKENEATLLSEREVMVATIQHVDSKFSAEGKSDEYLRARFDMTIELAGKETAAHTETAKKTDPAAGPEVKTDSASVLERARTEHAKRTEAAGKAGAPEGAIVKA